MLSVQPPTTRPTMGSRQPPPGGNTLPFGCKFPLAQTVSNSDDLGPWAYLRMSQTKLWGVPFTIRHQTTGSSRTSYFSRPRPRRVIPS